MMKPSLKRLRSKAKYKTNTKEYAVWNEYDLTTGDRVLVSGGTSLKLQLPKKLLLFVTFVSMERHMCHKASL
jgi:hypothetical protein